MVFIAPLSGGSSGGLEKTQNRIDETGRQLASGERLVDASVDPAGLAVLVDINSQVSGNEVAIRNSLDGISAIQIAEGGVNQVGDALQQVRELALQAQNGTLSESDRNSLQRQADELLAGVQDSLGQVNFNGQPLLAEDGEISLQTGPEVDDGQTVRTFDVSGELEGGGLFGIDISDPASLEVVDQSLSFLNTVSGELGAGQNRLESTISRLGEANINETAAASRIGDTDFAQTISDRAAAMIQQEVGIAVQAQANANQKLVLNLLG